MTFALLRSGCHASFLTSCLSREKIGEEELSCLCFVSLQPREKVQTSFADRFLRPRQEPCPLRWRFRLTSLEIAARATERPDGIANPSEPAQASTCGRIIRRCCILIADWGDGRRSRNCRESSAGGFRRYIPANMEYERSSSAHAKFFGHSHPANGTNFLPLDKPVVDLVFVEEMTTRQNPNGITFGKVLKTDRALVRRKVMQMRMAVDVWRSRASYDGFRVEVRVAWRFSGGRRGDGARVVVISAVRVVLLVVVIGGIHLQL